MLEKNYNKRYARFQRKRGQIIEQILFQQEFLIYIGDMENRTMRI